MIGTRYEEYTVFEDDLPFCLQIGLERTPLICSKEQNWHENIEIQWCTDGEGTVLLNGERCAFRKGDIVVVNSNVIHYTATANRLVYTCLIVSATFCKQMGIAYDRLQFASRIQDAKLLRLLERLTETYTNTTLRLRTAKLHTAVLELLTYLTEQHATARTVPTAHQKTFDTVKSAILYIRSHYTQKMTLEEIARFACTDKYTLCRAFKKIAGQTVTNYVNRYRCQQAVACLRTGNTVAQAAYLCGFENLSFFTKTFQKHMGVTPSKCKGECI